MNRSIYLALAAVFVFAVLAQTAGVIDAPKAAGGQALRLETKGSAARPAKGASDDAIEIARDSSGQFRLNVAVNGQETPFLVDTGADTVALTVEEAERLGLDIDPDSFGPIGQSASGTAYGQQVTIDQIEIAGSELRNIEAVVIDGLEENLLGQTVLAKLEGVELRGDKMLIHRR